MILAGRETHRRQITKAWVGIEEEGRLCFAAEAGSVLRRCCLFVRHGFILSTPCPVFLTWSEKGRGKAHRKECYIFMKFLKGEENSP